MSMDVKIEPYTDNKNNKGKSWIVNTVKREREKSTLWKLNFEYLSMYIIIINYIFNL